MFNKQFELYNVTMTGDCYQVWMLLAVMLSDCGGGGGGDESSCCLTLAVQVDQSPACLSILWASAQQKFLLHTILYIYITNQVYKYKSFLIKL